VDSVNDIDRKHDITIDIMKLKEKHPKVAELKRSTITNKPETNIERVIFENVTQDEITFSAKN